MTALILRPAGMVRREILRRDDMTRPETPAAGPYVDVARLRVAAVRKLVEASRVTRASEGRRR